MRTKVLVASALLVLATAAVLVLAHPGGANDPQGASALVLGVRTKTDGCTVLGALPDRACTPGAVILSVSRDQICTRGYTRAVRDVPDDVKSEVYAEYGIPSRRGGQYEVDHLVSLELGGSNDIANLWPEAAEPKPGFHEKDRYENFLHEQLCAGVISLTEAQRRIAEDWLKYWQDAGRP